MRNLLRAATVGVCFVASMGAVQTAASATADGEYTVLGGCSSFPPTPCGEVQNNSVRPVRVSLNWTCTGQSTAPLGAACVKSITAVGAHSHIGGGNVDVDAFEVSRGCQFSVDINGSRSTKGPGWYKITSVQTATILSTTCSVGS